MQTVSKRALLCRTALMFLFALGGCQCNDQAENNEEPICIDCDDPCAADPCAADRVCETAGDTYVCRCAPGLVEVGDECTDDPCAGDACGGRANTECVKTDGQAMCRCLPGYELDASQECVEVTNCSADTCAMRGACVETADGPECTCDVGYTGRFCESCDATAGYVDDGSGGCTADPCEALSCADDQECVVADDGSAACVCQPGFHDEEGRCVPDTTCMPNSCNGAGACDDSGGVVTCACDTGFAGQFCGECDQAGGYHDDGMGGCTMDECLPNPCTDPNKTSCTSSGPQQYECSCDAGYHDEGGTCVADETCQADSCNGHGTCDDSTNVIVCACQPGYVGTYCDQCDANAGYRPDGSGGCTTLPCTPNALPDDGFDCTVDTCPNGLAVHTPDDSACDDGLWCSGVEACAPADPNADARGCVSPAPPSPPASPSPCQYYGACDEQSQSFPLLDRSAGDSCSDGIVCSSGDVCDANGNCAGTLQPGCPGGNCSTTSALTSVDVVEAWINPTVTYDGQDPVVADLYTSFGVWAVNRANGTWTGLANYYGYSTTPDMTYGERLLPGVYDIMYMRTSGSRDDRFSLTDGSQSSVYGRKTLQEGIVLGAGVHDLVIDIPVADINPTVTYDGQDPVAADLYTSFGVWAVNKDNGTWTGIANYYGYSTTPDMTYGEKLLPGTYDIMYMRTSGSRDDRFSLTDGSQSSVYGRKILQRDVVITEGGANNLAIDIPVADINPTVTYDGQDPVAADLYTSFGVWAVNQDNGTWTGIANYYGYSTTPDMTYGAKLLPGTYDIMYMRTSGSRDDRFSLTDGSQSSVYGRKILQQDVVITEGGANNLAIDIPVADINPTVTYDGQDPVAADLYTSFGVWAVNQDNGTWTGLANYYGYSTTPDMTYGAKLLPGTYDIMYMRTSGSLDDRFSLTDTSQSSVYGRKILQQNVVITAGGSNNLAIDIPVADVSPTVTYDGQDPVVADLYTSFGVWAVNQDNGTWTGLANYYGYSTTPDMTYGEKLLPGTYDIMYMRTSGSLDDRFSLTDGSQSSVYGRKVLQKGVVVSANGANNLIIDVPVSAISPDVTYAGQDPVVADLYTSFGVWAVSRDDGTWTGLANYYGYSTTPDMTYGEKLLPGTYDIMYMRTSGSRDDRFSLTDGSQNAVYGRQIVQQCVAVP